jgi:pilus assembly protein CpaE
MKIVLIYEDAQQLASVQQSVQAEGYELTDILQRTADTTLQSLIDTIQTDVLIVDCTGPQSTQDIVALESFLNTHPQVGVLMLSQSRDANTLVAAMQAGVRELLTSPPTAADLAAALRRFAVRMKAVSGKNAVHAKTIAFMSCKGGSGSTLLAVNFADILAKDFEKKTALLDLDLQSGDAAYYFSQEPTPSDITLLTQQIERLDIKLLMASMLHIGPNFDLLAAPEDPATHSTISSLQLERLLQLVETQYEMVVLDVDHVLSPLTIKALNRCDVVFLVMENLLPFVRDAKRLVRRFRALGYDDSKIRIIVNRYEKNGTIDISEIEKAIGLKVSHTIRSSFSDVAQAINMGAPITEINPNNTIVQVLRDIAHGFDSTHPNRGKRWIDRFIGTHN